MSICPFALKSLTSRLCFRIVLCLVFTLCIAMPSHAIRTVTDEAGRTVTVPDHPHRLICLVPSIVDDLYALGAGDDIIAVTDYTHYPPQASRKRSIGLPLSPSIETIVSLHPDLVLGDATITHADTIERLQHLGIAVFMVAPHSIEDIYRSLESIGSVLHREQSAQVLVHRLRARELAVRQRASGKRVVTVLMPLSTDPVITIGARAYITELIAIAGGRSVTCDLAQEWPQVSLEAVLAWAPDALIIEKNSKISIEQIRALPGWLSLPAIQHNKVYFVDDRILVPSPVAFDALEELAKQFHP